MNLAKCGRHSYKPYHYSVSDEMKMNSIIRISNLKMLAISFVQNFDCINTLELEDL